MCTFITATLNADANLPALHGIFERTIGGFYVVEGAPVAPQLPNGRIYLAHDAFCDCGTAMGQGSDLLGDPFTERDLARLRKKGWPDAKIERWMEAKRADKEKKRREQRGFEEMDTYIEAASTLLASRSVTVFGLMHHFGEEPKYASFEVKLATPVPIEYARPEDLLALPADTLLEFYR